MSSPPTDPGRDPDSDDTDRRFAEIVAGWGSASDVPDSPAAETSDEDDSKLTAEDTSVQWRPVSASMLEPEVDNEHYSPPPAPPLRRPSQRSLLALLVVIVGCVLLFFPTVVGLSGTGSSVAGVTLIGGGVVLLLLQLRDDIEDPDDDGSRI